MSCGLTSDLFVVFCVVGKREKMGNLTETDIKHVELI